MIKFVAVGLTMSTCASIALPSSASGQVAQSGYTLPLDLAVEAAITAIDACKSPPEDFIRDCKAFAA
jgi:hypothetical protein